MRSQPLRGLTWDHPRGYGPLEHLASIDKVRDQKLGTVTTGVEWDRQPLAGFESTPLEKSARGYDLLVIDHPHIADAVAHHVLIPLSRVFSVAKLASWRAQSAGPSFESYGLHGSQWALPVDAATQVVATQAGVQGFETWQDVITRGAAERIVLCLGGPHAFLMLAAILVAMGEDVASPAQFVAQAGGRTALDTLRDIYENSDQSVGMANPIQVLDAMVADPNISACPLIYGYVNYSSAKRHGPLVFTDAPCWGEGRRPGSVLGGAGMAVTSTATNLNAIAVYLERVASEKVQRDVFPRFGGQPAASAAWDEGDVNAESMDFYRNTRRTLDDAWVRPRLSGWSEFQEAGAVLVRKVLSQTITTCEAVGLINNKYRDVVKQEK